MGRGRGEGGVKKGGGGSEKEEETRRVCVCVHEWARGATPMGTCDGCVCARLGVGVDAADEVGVGGVDGVHERSQVHLQHNIVKNVTVLFKTNL